MVQGRGVRRPAEMATFLDTNVLVYAFDVGEPKKRHVVRTLLADRTPCTLSSQVLSEFYWITTRKLRPSLTEDVAQAVIRRLTRVAHVVAVDASLVAASIALARDNQIALWDAQIVVAAARSGCDVVLTEDLNHGQVISGVTIRNPFLDS